MKKMISTSLVMGLVLLLGCGGCEEDNNPPPIGSPPNLGAPCAYNIDCSGGLSCHATAAGQGRCTAACDADACQKGVCLADASDLWGQWRDLCALPCDGGDTCPEGLECITRDEGAVCAPSTSRPETSTLDWPQLQTLLDIQCGATKVGERPEDGWTLYDIPLSFDAATTRAWITPFVASGQMENLQLSWAGQTLDMVTDYRHHSNRFTQFDRPASEPMGTYGVVASEWAFLFPMAPQFQDLLVPEQPYTLRVATSAPTAPCLHLWQESAVRQTLHLNVYLTGVLGLNAQQAPFDYDMQTIVDQVRRLLTIQAGFERVEIDFFDMPESVRAEFGIIRSIDDIRALTGMGKVRGKDRYWSSALDVFMVQEFQIDQLRGLVGYSGALPGAPGLSGHGMQGLTFASYMLGTDNVTLGTIIAHEIGHYLGLRHTTEVIHNHPEAQPFDARLGTTDPIVDTPVCENIRENPYACIDSKNLMFPLTPPNPSAAYNLLISPGQNFVLIGEPPSP